MAWSTSKMPPQQPDGLLDVVDEALCFCAHESSNPGPQLTIYRTVCNYWIIVAAICRLTKMKICEKIL
ncbi:MAG: hypothetical protein OJF62_003387 [Pseudolabrys sp.]|nr:hypothetical protein [Pseudolabrys sp.]